MIGGADDLDDEELVALGRGLSLLPPSSLPPSTARSASPLSMGFQRNLMVQYATEPRSRPTSPNSRAVSPVPPTGAGHRLAPASPRLLGRRSSSPGRAMLSTSFCGAAHLRAPDAGDEVAARAPSPAPSLSVANAVAVRYATEPRSRPASPLPPVAADLVTRRPALS